MDKAQFAILRFAKYKGPEIGNIEAHNERTKEKYASNPDIDVSRSKYNFHLIEPQGKYRAVAEKQIADAGCRTRKDSVRVVEALVTASPEFFKSRKRGEVREYFEHALRFIEKHQPKETIISAVVHMDEKTPHMHLSFVPLTEDKRLSAKEIIGNKKKLTWWQDEFWKHMVKKYPELERGESASETGRDHIPPRIYKEAVHLSRMKEQIMALMADTNLLNKKAKSEEMETLLDICYVDACYGSFSQRNYDVAVTKAADDRSYHPIKDYFESLPVWDEIPRVDTVLIDYLGAQDNEYVRAVTRKALCAAYMRIYHPGIKFDYITVLNGEQGIGKSTLIAKLGMEWFADSLTLSDMNDKTAAEKLQGYWIHEIGEMAGMRKADLEKVKAFVSRCDDKYRASFGRRVTPHPRQCIFFGTTNSENGYLRDITGNRRFWNVRVPGTGRMKPWDLTQEIIDQIWAEVIVLAKGGEELFLSHELEEYAKKEQSEAMERDDREGLVARYLDMLLPETWDTMDVYQRREYVQDPDSPLNVKGTVRRETVSNIEIWCECFGKAKEDIKPSDSYALAAIMTRFGDWERTAKSVRLPIYGKQRVYQRK
uniref:MobV family relaxase n=1 Tax=Gemmiger formicilis TaxID=745368 RepID=UPI003FEE30FE